MANEMRLIDAYALAAKFMEYADIEFDGEGVANAIANSPTVDARPVVHGNWEDGRAVHNGKEVYKSIDCSVCHDIFKIESHDREYWKNRFKNCPFCGSQMDGGNEDG